WVGCCGHDPENRKLPRNFNLTGGRGEIRTHEGAKPPAGFQDRCLKPLGHPSIAVASKTYAYSLKNRLATCYRFGPNLDPSNICQRLSPPDVDKGGQPHRFRGRGIHDFDTYLI